MASVLKHHRELRFTPEQWDFLRRRTRPFLDSIGIERSLPFLLEEAYLQGMKDAMQVVEECDADLEHYA
jgi:hypothetical protein